LRQFIKHGDNKNSLDNSLDIPTMMDIREMIYNKMSGENLSFD